MQSKIVLLALMIAMVVGGAAVADAGYLRLQKGEIFSGELVEFTKTGILFRTDDGAVVEFKFKEVHPKSYFDLKKTTIANEDEEALLELAAYGMKEGLLVETRTVIEGVIKLRGEFQETAYDTLDALRSLEAKDKLRRADRLLMKEEFARARELCHVVMKDYSDTPSSSIARDFIDEIIESERLAKTRDEQRDRQEELKKQQEKEAKERAKLDELLKRITANRREAKGLRATGLEAEAAEAWTKSVRSYEAAERLYMECLYILQKYFIKVKFQRVDYVEKAESLVRKVNKNRLRCYTEHTSAYISVPNWKMALRTVKRALLIDPNDEIARELMRIIRENYIHFSVKEMGRGNGSSDD